MIGTYQEHTGDFAPYGGSKSTIIARTRLLIMEHRRQRSKRAPCPQKGHSMLRLDKRYMPNPVEEMQVFADMEETIFLLRHGEEYYWRHARQQPHQLSLLQHWQTINHNNLPPLLEELEEAIPASIHPLIDQVKLYGGETSNSLHVRRGAVMRAIRGEDANDAYKPLTFGAPLFDCKIPPLLFSIMQQSVPSFYVQGHCWRREDDSVSNLTVSMLFLPVRTDGTLSKANHLVCAQAVIEFGIFSHPEDITPSHVFSAVNCD